MKVKRIVIFCLIWAVLALLCCAVFYQSAAVFHFTYINRVLDTENYSIVVDDDNTTITILQLDSNHQAVSKIEYEKVSQNRFNLPLRLFQDGDNTYLCNFQNEIGSTEAYYTLYLLDFEHQEMQLCWNYYPGSYMEEVSQLGTVQDQSLIQVTVEDGVVQMVLCVYFEGDENAHYLTYQIQENGCVLISDQAYYESTMSFGRAFSTQSGMVILNAYAYVYCGDQQINHDKYSRLFLSLDGTLFGVNRSKQRLDVIDPALATAYPW